MEKADHPITRPASVVGLAGGIGSGKSVVARILAVRGYSVYDCDSRAKELMCRSPLKERLKEIVGQKCFAGDDTLDRGYLASRIFTDEKLRCEVNRIVHQAVRDDIALQRCKRHKNHILFVESAIFATAGLDKEAFEIWLVEAAREIRINRIRRRDPGLSDGEIERRLSAQQHEESLLPPEKIKRIDNSGQSSLLLRLDSLEKELIKRLEDSTKILNHNILC